MKQRDALKFFRNETLRSAILNPSVGGHSVGRDAAADWRRLNGGLGGLGGLADGALRGRLIVALMRKCRARGIRLRVAFVCPIRNAGPIFLEQVEVIIIIIVILVAVNTVELIAVGKAFLITDNHAPAARCQPASRHAQQRMRRARNGGSDALRPSKSGFETTKGA